MRCLYVNVYIIQSCLRPVYVSSLNAPIHAAIQPTAKVRPCFLSREQRRRGEKDHRMMKKKEREKEEGKEEKEKEK